jgi:hypothetical protein
MENRNKEAELIGQGRVSKNKEKYSSNLALYRAKQKEIDSRQYAESRSMISSEGDNVPMEKIMESSLANPFNRRSELMVRMAGFEMFAQNNGFVGEFYTITTPSKFHRFTGDMLNINYDPGLTPKDAQKHLVTVWANIRKRLDENGIKVFGFRVAEPHHDGCPHWHMLLFMLPEDVSIVRENFSHYSLLMDGDEKGAKQRRFTHVAIDPNKGSATGYIAKYISKNLGFSLEDGETNDKGISTEYGKRVKAWASLWGIRQFQQIGGAPVTVWRELRKVSDTQEDETIEKARQAADGSRWEDFLNIMGGATVKRKDLPITLVKKNCVNPETGEMKQSKYGELVVLIYGIQTVLTEVITRSKSWIMLANEVLASLIPDVSGNGPLNEDEKEAGKRALACVASALFTPWNLVNNCPDRT